MSCTWKGNVESDSLDRGVRVDIGSGVFQEFKGVDDDVVVCFTNDGRCVLRFNRSMGGTI